MIGLLSGCFNDLRVQYWDSGCKPGADRVCPRCAQGIAGRALVISAGIIANIIFAYSILLAQVPLLTSSEQLGAAASV